MNQVQNQLRIARRIFLPRSRDNKYVNGSEMGVINGTVCCLEEETLVPLVAMCRRVCRVRYGQSYLHPLPEDDIRVTYYFSRYATGTVHMSAAVSHIGAPETR